MLNALIIIVYQYNNNDNNNNTFGYKNNREQDVLHLSITYEI